MSRTYKDRPYWVKMNDRRLGTVENHDHRERLFYRKVLERGEYQLVPCGEITWILRYSNETPGMTPEEYEESRYPTAYYYQQAKLFPPHLDPFVNRGHLRWYYEQPMRWEWVGRTYEDAAEIGCDLGPWRSGRYRDQRNCTVDIYEHNRPYSRYWYNRPPNKEMREQNERRRRRSAHQNIKTMRDEYNTFGDVDDSRWNETAPNHTPFGGGWWD